MKQVLQNMKTGEMKIQDVPAPALRAGGILVKNHFSLISPGTERIVVEAGKMNLVQKARSRPEDVRRVLTEIRQSGFRAAYRKVMSKLDSLKPLGYSSAGIVLAVDSSVSEFSPGDRVACAGIGYASHADIIFVPKNLAVKVPEGVGLDEAAYTTLGAIALQGVRQAAPTIGERIVVIGLGLVGLLACQILKANGCQVLGIDLDPGNVELGKKVGLDASILRTADVKSLVGTFTDGYGADAVLIAAATKSSDPLALAGEIARDRSRVVMIGATGMNLPRGPYYTKEIDFKLSRSYGPGRYDRSFEEGGIDYPIGYVRWTERRNMMEFLRLVKEEKISIDLITTHRFPIEGADKAYRMIGGESKEKYLGIILEYNQKVDMPDRRSESFTPRGESFRTSPLKIGFIGAGSFAQASLLPAVRNFKGAALETVCTSTGATAVTIKNQYGFRSITTDSGEVFSNQEVGTVFIATRHNLHASLVVDALKSGKNVFVEKPLAMNESQLVEIGQFYRAHEEKDLPLLMVGFNRRFAPIMLEVDNFFRDVKEPRAISYRVNAGFVDKSHWTQDPEEGGGRIVGEVCHFVDLIQFIAGSTVDGVFAQSISSGSNGIVDSDNLAVTLKMKNGSLGSIIYLANGDSSVPKERIEITAGRRTAIVENFQYGYLHMNGKSRRIGNGRVDKGISNEVNAFLKAVASKKEQLIPFDELVNSTLTTFRILTSLSIGEVVSL